MPRPIPLRPTPAPPPADARVIDARYRIVGRKRAALRRLGMWVLAFVIAAFVGFLLPPVWVTLQDIFAARG